LFHWVDPLKLDAQLTVDERMVHASARACSQDRLAPRGLQAFLHEQTDPAILREMGGLDLVGPTLPKAHGGAGLNYVCCGLVASEVERVESGSRSMMSVKSSLMMAPIFGSASKPTSSSTCPAWPPAAARLLWPDRARPRIRPRQRTHAREARGRRLQSESIPSPVGARCSRTNSLALRGERQRQDDRYALVRASQRCQPQWREPA